MAVLKKKPKRIDIKVETLPYSFRTFIEKTMSDETKFTAFAESPITALVNANIPIDARALTEEDAEHLVLVLGKIHAYVKASKFSKDVKFEEVFNVVTGKLGEVAYAVRETHSHTWRHITPDTFTVTTSEQGINTNFRLDGLKLKRFDDILTSPLISPAEFKNVLVILEKGVDAQLKGMG